MSSVSRHSSILFGFPLLVGTSSAEREKIRIIIIILLRRMILVGCATSTRLVPAASGDVRLFSLTMDRDIEISRLSY